LLAEVAFLSLFQKLVGYGSPSIRPIEIRNSLDRIEATSLFKNSLHLLVSLCLRGVVGQDDTLTNSDWISIFIPCNHRIYVFWDATSLAV